MEIKNVDTEVLERILELRGEIADIQIKLDELNFELDNIYKTGKLTETEPVVYSKGFTVDDIPF